tara:strand:- start:5752 stop:12882 length:7131 start_codon:yes stop_codon:yes gene_type:complete
MADKKEFSDFQTYKCDILTKEDIELPKFCPTCEKDPSYVEPTWYTTSETYLDKKNCLYKFNVTKVIDDLRLGEEENKLKSFAITFTNHVQENRNYKSPEVESKILRTAAYNMLIDLDKELTYRHICNNSGCVPVRGSELSDSDKERIEVIIHDLRFLKESIINDIEDGDSVEFIGIQVEQAAQDLGYDPLDVSSHFEYRLDLDEGEQLSPILQVTLERYDDLLDERDSILRKAGIDLGSFNPYGIENYATIEDYYFPADENGGNIIQFLVSVPAFVLDRVPASSTANDEDEEPDGIDDFQISGRKIRSQMRILRGGFYLYQQQYAISRYLDDTAMYYSDQPLKEYNFTRVRTHIKTFPGDGKLDFNTGEPVFFKLLKDALSANNFRLDNFVFGGLNKKLARNIKFKVKKDSERPYQITKILVDSRECRFKKLKGGKARKLITYLNNHRFISAFLSKINEIESDLTANETPEWHVFIPKYSYPEVVVQKAKDKDGLASSDERLAIECLLEDAGIDALGSGQIRNYLLEKFISLPKLLAYVFNQRACFQFDERFEMNPTNDSFGKIFGTASRLDADMQNRFYQNEVDKTIEASKKIEDIAVLLRELNPEADEGGPYLDAEGQDRTVEEVAYLIKNNLEDKPYEEITLEIYSREIAFYMDRDYGEVLDFLEKKSKDNASAKVSTLKGTGFLDGEPGSFFTGDSGHPLLIRAAELAKENFGYEDSMIKEVLEYKRGTLLGTNGFDLEDLFSFFGICGFKSLLGSVLECLLGGVSFQQFVSAFIQSQLKNLSVEKLGLFVDNLPPEEQAKVYAEVQQALGTLVKPWESEQSFTQTVNSALSGQPLTFDTSDTALTSDEINQFSEVPQELAEWQELSSEERQEAIDTYGRPKVDVENPEFTGDFTQSSVGTAVNNVVGIFIKAYTNAIINSVDLDVLLDKVKDFPGSQILKRVLFQFACMTPPLMHPPVAEFLKSFTVQICDPQVGITLPRLTNFKLSNIWSRLKFNLILAIVSALIAIIIEAIVAIIQKILELLDGLLCRALEGIGKFTANAIGDALFDNGKAMSFRTAMREAFCGPDVPTSKVDELAEALLNNYGYAPPVVEDAAQNILNDNAKTPAQRTMSILSGLMSKEEFLYHFAADPSDYDTTQINLMSRAINASAPEMSSVLGTPDQLSNLFAAVSNFLSPDQRRLILDSLQNPIPEEPVNQTLCLTNEDYEKWRQKRRKLYDDFGFDDPEEIVDNQDRQLLDDLNDLLDAYTNPLGAINDGVNDLLQEPICPDGKGIIPRDSDETRAIADQVSNDIFKNLQFSIYRDLFGNNGYLNELLADTKGKPLKRHNFRSFFQRNYVNAEDENPTRRDAKGIFPETVAIHMRDQIEQQTIGFSVKNGTKTLTPRLEAGIKKKPEIFASAINEDRDETYTTSKGRTRDLNRKRIKVNLPAKKIHQPNFSLSYTDGLERDRAIDLFDVKSYNFEITYGDRKNNNPEGQIWNEISITAGFGEDRGESTIYRNQEEVPQAIIDLYGADTQSSRNPRLAYFRSFLNSKIQVGAPNAQNFGATIKEVYEDLNKLFLDQMTTLSVSDPEGNLSQGFEFGYKAEELEKDDLEYVDPEEGSTEYTYDNDEQILGRSKTNNPRVVYLDPEIYGGRYTNPPFMIEPADHSGWYGFSLNLIPKNDFCNKKQIDLIGFPYIKKEVNFYYNILPSDERLQQEEECVTEPPFNKISNRQTKANLHGICAAIVRMYLSQAYLNGYPMFANISFNSNNYSDVLYDFVADLIEDDLSDTPNRENAFVRSKLKRENYFLLFLEQAVESYQRLIDYKGVKPPTSTLKALNIIRKVQAFYKQPDKTDIDRIRGYDQFTEDGEVLLGQADDFKLDVSPNEYELITDRKYLKFYRHALAYQGWGEAIFRSDNRISLRYIRKTDRYLKYMRLVSKIFCIRLVKKQAMEVLSEFTKYEADKLFKQLDRRVKSKPPIHRMIPYMLQDPNISVLPKFKYGLRQPLVELNVNGEGNFGQVLDVQHNIFETNPLQFDPFMANVNTSGKFIIERYIRVKDKEDIPLQVSSRNENLFGVVNMERLQQYLGNLDQSKKISDYFGDLEFVYSLSVEELVAKGLTLRGLKNLGLPKDIEVLTPSVLQQRLQVTEDLVDFSVEELEPIGIKGGTGLSYGIRICYFPSSNLPVNQLSVSDETARLNKAFKMKPVDGIQNSSFMIPLIEAEVQIKDQVLSEVDFFDGPNAFDLYCMFRELENNEEYKFLFNTVIPIPTYMSMFALYSNFGFQASWGLSEDERDKPEDDNEGDDEEELDLDGDGDDFDFDLYSKSKKKARKIFVNFYNQNDFLDDEGAGEDNLFEFMRLFNPFKFRLPFRLPWWKRRRLRDYRCEDNE